MVNMVDTFLFFSSSGELVEAKLLTCLVAETPDEWLRSILGPVLGVVERARVPDGLVHQLWHGDWV